MTDILADLEGLIEQATKEEIKSLRRLVEGFLAMYHYQQG